MPEYTFVHNVGLKVSEGDGEKVVASLQSCLDRVCGKKGYSIDKEPAKNGFWFKIVVKHLHKKDKNLQTKIKNCFSHLKLNPKTESSFFYES